MKAYRGCGCIAPLILDLGAKWRWVVNFTPRPLSPLANSPGTHRIEVSVCPGSVWPFRRREKSLPSTGNRNPKPPARAQWLYRPSNSWSYRYLLYKIIFYKNDSDDLLRYKQLGCNHFNNVLVKYLYMYSHITYIYIYTHTHTRVCR